MTKNIKRASLGWALLPIGVLILFMGLNVYFFGEDSSYGPNQIALLLAAAVGGLVGLKYGATWSNIYKGIVEGISSALGAIIILLLIGALAGTWLISGIVPAMIYYGLQILNPTIFLFAATVCCAIISLATGSSWSTIATIGIALLGIGQALGFSDGWIAGAIISGAYFGDKMSPLSDTTNLAPAVSGTDIFTHIRHMAYTTVPSISITLIIFLIAGFTGDKTIDQNEIDTILNSISANFNITWMLFLVPAGVIFLIIKRVPAIPALLAGSLLGGLFAIIFQPDLVSNLGGTGNYAKDSYLAVIKSMAIDTEIITPNEKVNNLLSSGGMSGMLNTVWLILCALTFGGIMQAVGLLKRITEAIITWVHGTGSLIASTAATCIFFNLTASDQYMAIVVPGKMFAETYEDMGLKAENLSRTLEDAGTVTSVLVPWNTCGVYQYGVLGVATMTYLPFCFFNLISPVMTIIFGLLDIKITKIQEPKNELI